uniref:Head fiber protein n=1 Tax=Siphoviridae sp. ctOkv13 TaxID=2826314 RepID=A0A8S5M310_9CAUD|nr:MAG TPA: Head fiber protein [Siphoviridae sp. ctOkv13]
MSMDFGKLNFAVGFNRTSAFPLDANSYFESYTDAVTAAAGAAVVGSSDSAYYIGQLIIVNESGKFGLYQIGADKTLVKFGQASSADDLKSQLDELKARVDGLDNSKADWFGGTAPVDKNGEIVTIGAAGSITASGIKIVNSAVNNSTTEVPTSKAVQTYVASQVASAVQYLGTVSALTGLSTTAGKGDFYRLSAAVAGGHAGDLVIAEKDNPAQLIDGTNWSLIHGEEVGVEAINAGDGIKVITTGEGSSEAQPTIAMKPATTTTIGGIIVGTNLTVDATGKLSAIDTTYEDATTTTHGLMSTADKSKLDGIAEGANKTIVDASLNATSTNPVENKAVHAEFNSVRTALADASSDLQSKIDNHTTLIGNKVDKVKGKGLSTNDYTTEEKNKLASLKNYILPIASVDELGGVLVHSLENPGGEVSTPKSTTNRDYGIKIDQDGNLWVTIPWTDTKYTLPVASEGALGGIKVGYSGTTAKTYAVKLDANNKAYVEVPWQNTTYTNGNGLTLTGTAFSLNVASSAMHGGIKLYNDKLNKEITPQAASEVNGRYYRIQLDNANRAFVNVPWTDTTYTLPTAKQDELGGIKLEYAPMTGTATINAETTTAGRFYAINVDKDGYAFVNVPWTDTKYTLPIATDQVLGGIKSGNKANNFVAGSAGEGQTGNVPNYEAEVVVNPTTGKATVNLEAMAGPETQWSIVAGQTVFGIRQVSTDKLVQGTNTLIINGGGAAW